MKKTFTVKNLIMIAITAAVITVCSWITVPFFTIPFTMQTFAVFFALKFLGGRDGLISILVYTLLGAVGVPVFSGFGAGFGVLAGPTGGYIAGFTLCAALYLACGRFTKKSALREDAVLLLGLLLCYAFGTVWFVKVMNDGGAATTFWGALSACVLPFVAPDIVKLVLAHILAARLKKVRF